MENPELDLAFKYLEETGINVFLTGKAGTGKTTFLHHLKQKTPKRMIVLAPTGVAAINAGGVTIHSFFQLPFAPYLPEMFHQQSGEKKVDHQFSKTKINIIRSIDLLVIDEISMVRADLLDAVDDVLRRFRRNSKPFGGVQMLMIGDLQQLTPVVTDEEKELLQRFYPSPFFFDSKALKTINFVSIELKHIYRQQDPKFIDLLNSVRENKISEKTRALLNQRYIPDFEPSDEEKFITLTTHNSQAKQINSKKMELLDGKTYTFDAQIIDNFPEYLFPTDEYLELKLKTQVMFVKNDSSALKQYFNGKIGVITDIGDDHLEVTCEGDENPIEVLREEWTNAKYTIDEESKAIVEKVEGRFIQFPLKAAWAITIHKSQGLTFEKAIIDANKAFAHGQVYVALSRCRSLEGMVLTSPISQNSLILDHNIEQFSNEKSLQQPSFQNFLQSAKNYYKELLIEQFDFSIVKENFSFYSYRVNDFFNKIYPEYVTTVKEVLNKYNETVIPVSERFQKQLERLVYYSENYLKDAALSER
ncbi:MAG: AAA family ATPase, partial [Bacteroidales bacterium]|nr:AAA family ATPase [Bacteroidales bacterium]